MASVANIWRISALCPSAASICSGPMAAELAALMSDSTRMSDAASSAAAWGRWVCGGENSGTVMPVRLRVRVRARVEAQLPPWAGTRGDN